MRGAPEGYRATLYARREDGCLYEAHLCLSWDLCHSGSWQRARAIPHLVLQIDNCKKNRYPFSSKVVSSRRNVDKVIMQNEEIRQATPQYNCRMCHTWQRCLKFSLGK